jgi:hypothetical protein
MTARRARLRDAIRRPLPLGYHPLYRFYPGGSLTRAFRGLPERPDDWWSEDWVGSCTLAGNGDPGGRPQGLSPVEVPGLGPVALGEITAALPEEMVGAGFAARYGPITGVLVEPVRRGQTFALPASLPVRVRAGTEAVRVIRCLGPAVA